MVSLTLANAFLSNELHMSGTLPAKLFEHQASPVETRRTERATVFNALAGPCVVNDTCVTSPGFPSGYQKLDFCSIHLLDSLQHEELLGKSKFLDPTDESLLQAGKLLLQAYPNVQPFGIVGREHDNVCLAFAGNSQLVTEGSYIPAHKPDHLGRADVILDGAHGIFSGYTGFKQMFWIVLPVLVTSHLIVIFVVLKSSAGGSGQFWKLLKEYLRLGALWKRSQNEASETYVYSRPFCAQLALLGIGLALVLLNVLTPGVFDQGCTDPLVRSTIAPVKAQTAFQWLWLTLSAGVLYVVGFSIEQMVRADPRCRTQSVHRVLVLMTQLTSDNACTKRSSINRWREKMQQGNIANKGVAVQTKEMRRILLFYALLVPLIFVGSLPAIAFVFVQNAPFSEWYYNLLGNSLVLAVLQIGFKNCVAPRAATWLALIRHRKDTVTGIHLSDSAIAYYKTQVASLIILDVTTVLLAPIVSTIVFDEACFRQQLCRQTLSGM